MDHPAEVAVVSLPIRALASDQVQHPSNPPHHQHYEEFELANPGGYFYRTHESDKDLAEAVLFVLQNYRPTEVNDVLESVSCLRLACPGGCSGVLAGRRGSGSRRPLAEPFRQHVRSVHQ